MLSQPRWIAGLLLCLWLFRPAFAATPPEVVFLSPDDSTFWRLVAGFMEEVATDLDLDLEVQFDRDRHRFSYQQMARNVLEREDRPDYLVFMCKENVTEPMLTMAEKAGVKVFTFNTEVPTEARETLGLPRETLQNWIGHLVPDNVASGRQMAAMLTEQAAQMGLTEGDAPPPIIALSGTLDSSAAKDRNLGLMQAAQDHQVDLRQLIYANWSRDLAEEKTRVLMKRYPDIVAVWSASDGMAAGAIAAAKQAGRVPGKDVLIGGFDWEPEALQAIRSGELAVSFGRHFMGGGLVLMLLHEYHAGMDFTPVTPAATLKYGFEPVTKANIDRIARVMDPANWRRVDFRQLSRVHNPDLAGDAPSVEQRMDEFLSALANDGLRTDADRAGR